MSERAGNFQVLVAHADDGQDRTATIGFHDRIDARIETRADQRLDAGQRQFLELGIRQVDHLGHEIAGRDLVKVLVGELDRNRIVGQVGFGAERDRADLERGIAFDTLAPFDVGDLQAVDAAGRETVPAGNHQRLRIKIPDSADIPSHHHALGLGEQNLHGRRRAGRSCPLPPACRQLHRQYAGMPAM